MFLFFHLICETAWPFPPLAGYLQDGALAAHLACHTLSDKETMYWDRAVELYLKWGARGIVNYVEEHGYRRSSERNDGDCPTTTGFRGRSRYDVSVVNDHKEL